MFSLIYAGEYFFLNGNFEYPFTVYFFYYYPVLFPSVGMFIGVSGFVFTVLEVYIAVLVLYSIFFFLIISRPAGHGPRSGYLKTPAVFYALTTSAAFLATIAATALEQSFSVPILGQTGVLPTYVPVYVNYLSLIYAPFAEELAFRILPLGLFSFLLVIRAGRNLLSHSVVTETGSRMGRPGYRPVMDAFMAIIVPGHVRRKYAIKETWMDWALIIITSLLFGYAHFYFGDWAWGKMISATVTGFFLAFGYLKFGAYMDIPMHFFFNGTLILFALYGINVYTVSLLAASGILALIAGLYWILFMVKSIARRGVPGESGKYYPFP